MKNFFIITLMTGTLKLFCQSSSHGIALNVGDTYINTNAGYAGIEYAYRINPHRGCGLDLGVGTYYGSFNNNFKFIPESHLTLSYGIFLGEYSMTPHNINPSLGIHFLNVVRLKVGYSWEKGNENRGMKGITFGINCLFGSSGFYDILK